MSLRIPLTVRLRTPRADRDVTAEVRDLRFRSTAPGGFASMQIALDRPLSILPDEIDYYGSAFVYDGRHGGTVWEGRLEDPDRTASMDGEVWGITAIGPSAHTLDRGISYIAVDSSYERWEINTVGIKQRDIDLHAEVTEELPSILLRAPEGVTVPAGTVIADIVYRALFYCGQKLGRVNLAEDNGVTSADWENRLVTRITPAGAATTADFDTWSTTSGSLTASRGGSPAITADHDVANIRIVRTGAASTGTSTTWGEFWNIVVRALLKDKSGNDITSGYSGDTVLASQIVEDLLGRYLTKYDGENAVVTATSYAIEQFAKPDGTTPAGILDDLMLLEAGYYWAAWESNSAGKYRFEWVAWPTTVRYEADTVDGFSSPSSAEELYNEVVVRYRNARGEIKTTTRTQSVPILTAAGLTRSPQPIDLGDDVGTLTNANRVGDQFLADHQYPPNAGRLVVARPIHDMQHGRMVMPWEIRPGNLIRVRGVNPRVDALNPTGRDGTTIFRIVSVEFDARAAAAVLELDSYARTTVRALANLQGNPSLKWRRR